MRKVEFHYKGMGIKRYKRIMVPDCWEDLNERQFALCAEIYTSDISQYDFVRKFYSLSASIMKLMSGFEIYKLFDLVQFVLNPKGNTNFFFIKSIGTLMAPADRLSGISLEHFAIFDTAFFHHVNKPSDANLNRFIALLYTRQGEKVTEIDIDKRTMLVAKRCRRGDAYAIFLNYIFMHRWLSFSFPFLFEEKKDEDDQEDNPKKKRAIKGKLLVEPGWNSIIEGFVGDDIINYDKYVAMPAILAFKTINRRIKTHHRNGK